MSATEDAVAMCIGMYELGKVIGKGNFAVVRLATHTVTQVKVIIFPSLPTPPSPLLPPHCDGVAPCTVYLAPCNEWLQCEWPVWVRCEYTLKNACCVPSLLSMHPLLWCVWNVWPAYLMMRLSVTSPFHPNTHTYEHHVHTHLCTHAYLHTHAHTHAHTHTHMHRWPSRS